MLNVVDSSGWVEYLTKGGKGPIFRPVIQETQNLIVPTITIYEVFKRVVLLKGAETALEIAGVMSQGLEVGLDRKIAIDAAYISIERKLSMADSIILATAQAYDAILWTQDAHFKDIAGVRYIEKKL
jgi:predicted nucleic acid-binding protein